MHSGLDCRLLLCHEAPVPGGGGPGVLTPYLRQGQESFRLAQALPRRAVVHLEERVPFLHGGPLDHTNARDACRRRGMDVEKSGIDVEVAKADDRLADLLAAGLLGNRQRPHGQSKEDHGRACHENDGHKPVNREPSIHGDFPLPDGGPMAVWPSLRDWTLSLVLTGLSECTEWRRTASGPSGPGVNRPSSRSSTRSAQGLSRTSCETIRTVVLLREADSRNSRMTS
jgi:hypothetical protein